MSKDLGLKKTSDEWIKTQTRTFRAWINTHLKKEDMKIEDLQKGLEDGLMLCKLMEILSQKTIPVKPMKKVNFRIHKIQNNKIAIDFIVSEGIKLIACGAEDIVDGTLKIILEKIKKKKEKKVEPKEAEDTTEQKVEEVPVEEEEEEIEFEESDRSAQQQLLKWVQDQTAPYDDVNVVDFTKSWCDGRALAALVNSLKKSALDYEHVDKSDPVQLNNQAIQAAESHMDIPQLMDADDITNRPDKLSMMTYISYFREYEPEEDEEEDIDVDENIVAAESNKEIDPSECKVIGLKDKVSPKSKVVFKIEAYDKDGNRLAFTPEEVENMDEHPFSVLVSAKGVTVKLTTNDDGSFDVEYEAPNKVGKHKILVSSEGENIFGSPFKVSVVDYADPSKCEAEGEGLSKASIKKENKFKVICRNKDEEIRDEGGDEVEVKIYANESEDETVDLDVLDNEDGTYDVTYQPKKSGPHKIEVTVNGEHIKDSPFDMKTLSGTSASESKITGEPIENEFIEADKDNELIIEAHDEEGQPNTTGGDEFEVSIEEPNNDSSLLTTDIIDTEDGKYTVKFKPKVPGKHTVTVKLRGIQVAQSPYEFIADTNPSAEHSEVYGPGLHTEQSVDLPCSFKIQLKDKNGVPIKRGNHNLKVRINGPGESSIEPTIFDNENGTYDVSYTTRLPGEHEIVVELDGVPVAKSPYVFDSSTVPCSENSSVYDPKKRTKAGEPIVYKIKGYDKFGKFVPRGGAPFKTIVLGPDGKSLITSLNDNGNGTYNGYFMKPKIPGKYACHVMLNGQHVKNSPMYITVFPELDPTKCFAEGPGLEYSEFNKYSKPCIFNIHARDIFDKPFKPEDADPAEAKKNKAFIDRILNPQSKFPKTNTNLQDDKKTVKNEPTEEISDTHSLGGEFSKPVAFYSNPKEEQAELEGETNNPIYEPFEPEDNTKVTIPFDIQIENLDLSEDEKNNPDLVIKPTVLYTGNDDDATYTCIYLPKQQGDHKITVTLDSANIKDSPYEVYITEGLDPKQTTAEGPGLNKCYENKLARFQVIPRDSKGRMVTVGGEEFVVIVRDPLGNPCPGLSFVDDNGRGAYNVFYTPSTTGPHTIKVKCRGDDIVSSPFTVFSRDARRYPDPSYCEILNKPKHAKNNKPCKFTVKLCDADGKPLKSGADDVEVFVYDPKRKTNIEPEIVDLDNGKYNVNFIPRNTGKHSVIVRVNGDDINDCPMYIQSYPSIDPGKCELGKFSFIVKVPSGKKEEDITVTIDEPKEEEPDTESTQIENMIDIEEDEKQIEKETQSVIYPQNIEKLNENKFKVSYNPKDKDGEVKDGLYTVHVKLHGEYVKGAPFKHSLK